MKPFSQACENNKQVILEQLQTVFSDVSSVLEIGSGTGQHAVHFGEAMPQLQWQTSDLKENHPTIQLWLNDAALANVASPIELDIAKPWPVLDVDAVYTANTLHIISWPLVVALFENLSQALKPTGLLCVYGPFNYGGKFTSESNRNFDSQLKMRDSKSGLRDFEKIHALAEEADLLLQDDVAMPANNRLLIYKKI